MEAAVVFGVASVWASLMGSMWLLLGQYILESNAPLFQSPRPPWSESAEVPVDP